MANRTVTNALTCLVLLSTLAGGSCKWVGERLLTDRTPCEYYLPEGFVGWARITLGVPGAPPLSLRDGHYVIRFPASGKVVTSTPFEAGSARDSYWLYGPNGIREIRETGWGGGGHIWAGYIEGSTKQTPVSQSFFVGNERQYYKAIGDPRGN